MTKTTVTLVSYNSRGDREMMTTGSFKGLTKAEAQRLARCLRTEYDPVAADTRVGVVITFTITETL